MNDIAEITACWMFWKETVKRLKMFPNSRECQYMAARAQMDLVLTQALYFGKVRP